MKYSEFREYLKSNDFGMREDEEMIKVIIDTFRCIVISKKTPDKIALPFAVEEPEQFELIRKALELAETPLSEREEEKRCYLKHRFINAYTTQKYFNFTESGGAVLSNRLEDRIFKTKFTKAEREEFKEKFDTDLRDFEFIEAEED